MALIIGTFSLAVYSLGIPFTGIIWLRIKRNSLDTLELKERLGFLYSGFKA
jgi:hypothetical protein